MPACARLALNNSAAASSVGFKWTGKTISAVLHFGAAVL